MTKYDIVKIYSWRCTRQGNLYAAPARKKCELIKDGMSDTKCKTCIGCKYHRLMWISVEIPRRDYEERQVPCPDTNTRV